MQDRKQEISRDSSGEDGDRPLIVVGITHAQTCMVLPARLRALKAAGFRVVLISSPGPLLDRIAGEEAVEVLPIPVTRGFAVFADLTALVRLCRVLVRLRPEIV